MNESIENNLEEPLIQNNKHNINIDANSKNQNQKQVDNKKSPKLSNKNDPRVIPYKRTISFKDEQEQKPQEEDQEYFNRDN